MFISFLLTLAMAISVTCQIPPSDYPAPGEWQLLQESIGISAMHMQLLHDNKVVIFDRTDFGPSNISLPYGRCRHDPSDIVLPVDCTAHSVLYDVVTNSFRPLMVQTDVWCSSGSVLPDGTLVQTGGFNDGDHAVRTFTPCADESCDWIEHRSYLSKHRWYATNQILPDGRVIIVGGRKQFNYEFYPRSSSKSSFRLDFLQETRDSSENNLYPFVHLLPDGNLFIFANTRAISLDYVRNRVVKEFPPITGGEPRNYPSSGSSVLLPIDENRRTEAEIMVCGGSPQGGFLQASMRDFQRASSTCGRLRVSDRNPSWVMESMPLARVMGDMLLLPNGDVIIINGAESGTAGWENARDPVFRPVIYQLKNAENQRFFIRCASARPRMYHSSAVLLTDGRVLVGGSNPHVYYNFTDVEFPTDLSLEAYSPPYLSVIHTSIRPGIVNNDQVLGYGRPFSVTFSVEQYVTASAVSVNIIMPSFTTHSFAMNQRMVLLKVEEVTQISSGLYSVRVMGPSMPEIAPPGYYMMFVVHAAIPSSAAWVRIQ